MFSLFHRNRNSSATAVLEAEPTVVSVPTRVRAQPTIGEIELAEYTKLAEKVGFAPADLLYHRLVQFLHENYIDVYPLESVEKYLDQKFGKPIRPNEYSSWERKWGWHPLRTEDNSKLINHKQQNENGHIERETYRKIIPAPVLETVDLIATHFAGSEPAPHFYVADAVVFSKQRDPFLAMTAEGVPFFIIERWDEPAFRR